MRLRPRRRTRRPLQLHDEADKGSWFMLPSVGKPGAGGRWDRSSRSVTVSRKAELLCGRVDGAFRLRHDFVDLAAGNNKGWRKQHPVAGRAHDEAAVEAEVAAQRADITAIGEALFRLRVLGKLNAGDQSRAGDLADNGMVREGLAQHALEVRTGVVLHPLDNAFVTQELKV